MAVSPHGDKPAWWLITDQLTTGVIPALFFVWDTLVETTLWTVFIACFYGCVRVRIQMLSESDNFWQIWNLTDFQNCLCLIRIYLSLH